MCLRLLIFIGLFLFGFNINIAAQAEDVFKSTPYPVPRFVSIAKDKAYVRTGPGHQFPVKFIYERRGLPVEIVLEYDVWRKIRGQGGEGGWIHHSLLSGKRTGVIVSSYEDDKAVLYHKYTLKSDKLALLEPDVVVELKACEDDWCKVDAQGYKGWILRKNLWGVYDSEKFD